MEKAPVLLIGFNRPDNMAQVFSQIREAKPKVLYIAVDGPRPSVSGEDQKCRECQELAKKVDWPCELHTLFREKNVGCALGVSGAISWAFENEDRLIILEDDCVPVQSFFQFCDEMLEKFKDDTRVWQVCGRSHYPNSIFFEKSDYLFSNYAHIWGWATWKRCWNQYDLMMSDFPEFISIGGAYNVFHSSKLAAGANKDYVRIYKSIEIVSLHTWDYQWGYIKLKNCGLGIIPCVNLIRNIGASGAHANGMYEDPLPIEEMSIPLRHPSFIIANAKYDEYHYNHHIKKTILSRVKNKIMNM